MSEFNPNANQTLRKVVKLLTDHIVTVEGEADVGTTFSALLFDHSIF